MRGVQAQLLLLKRAPGLGLEGGSQGTVQDLVSQNEEWKKVEENNNITPNTCCEFTGHMTLDDTEDLHVLKVPFVLRSSESSVAGYGVGYGNGVA